MAARRKQFTIGSLMVVIALVAVFLAYPALFAGMLIPAAFLAFPFLFLAFLAFPLLMIEWLDEFDVWVESRRFRRSTVVDDRLIEPETARRPVPEQEL